MNLRHYNQGGNKFNRPQKNYQNTYSTTVLCTNNLKEVFIQSNSFKLSSAIITELNF